MSVGENFYRLDRRLPGMRGFARGAIVREAVAEGIEYRHPRFKRLCWRYIVDGSVRAFAATSVHSASMAGAWTMLDSTRLELRHLGIGSPVRVQHSPLGP